MTTLRLEIDTPTPSLNVWQRLHFMQQHREMGVWVWRVRAAMGRCSWAPRGRVRVQITRHSSHRLDHDNLYGGVKPLVDGLKACSLIVDDTEEAIDLVVDQGPMPSRTVVILAQGAELNVKDPELNGKAQDPEPVE